MLDKEIILHGSIKQDMVQCLYFMCLNLRMVPNYLLIWYLEYSLSIVVFQRILQSSKSRILHIIRLWCES